MYLGQNRNTLSLLASVGCYGYVLSAESFAECITDWL